MTPGARVGGGRLRVDAARAVDKLRDYQLADPALWVLEVIRAAVFARAERIQVHGDADDVVVAWEGPPIEPADLTRLFDELVDPSPAADRRHLRLLATGINTALGMEPRWVDVVACDGTGEAQAVRYAPRVLERKGDVAEGLRTLAVECRAPSSLAPARGMMIHLRRFPLLSAMPILVGVGEPRELTMVRRACDDIAVPLTLGGRSQLGRERSHEDLLRLELAGGLDGFLALLDPSFAQDEGRLEVAELGVQLARYTLPLAGLEDRRGKVPLRLFVNAPRMPTNASRSAVRIEEAPVRDALVQARGLLPKLVERLALELTSSAHPWSPTQRERLREAALALLAAAVAGERWRERVRALASSGPYGAAVAPLADVPLVRDAVGRPRAPASFSVRVGADVVERGADPSPIALAPWLGEVLWVPPGDPATRLCGTWQAPSAKELTARARGAERARERWMREPTHPATVPAAAGQLVAVPLKAPGRSLRSAVGKDVFAVRGLEGEVVVCDPRLGGGSALSLRLDGRELEVVALGSPVPVTAVAQCPALRPAPDYRGVERDDAFDAVLRAVRAAAVVACEALAWELLGSPKSGARATTRGALGADVLRADVLRRVARGGLVLAVDALGVDRVSESSTPLLAVDSIPLLGGGHRSAGELLAAARTRPGVVAWVSAGTHGALPGRVVQLEAPEVATFEALLGPTALVDYAPALQRPVVDVAALSLVEGSAGLLIDEPHRRVRIAWTDREPRLEVLHIARRLGSRPLEGTVTRCWVAVDDDEVVPGPRFTDVQGGGDEYPVAAWEQALARAFADALGGAPPAGLTVEAPTAARADVARSALLHLLGALDPMELLGPERIAALRQVALVPLLGAPEWVSLEALGQRFEGPIPFVPPSVAPGADLGDFHPALIEERAAEVYARLLGRPFVSATDELAQRQRAAYRAGALARHRALAPPPRAAWLEPVVSLSGRGYRGARVGFAPHADATAEVDLLVEGRFFQRWHESNATPIRAEIELDESAIDEAFAALTTAAKRAVGHVLARGARELLATLAERDPRALLAWAPARGLLAAWAGRTSARAADRKLAERLAAVPAFATVSATVHGEHVSVLDASTEQGAVRVAEWDEPWLGPDGESGSVYDGGVLRLSREPAEAASLRVILGALAPSGVRDVTSAVARLQAQRRIDRGLVEAPRLPAVVDARYRYALADLLADAPEAAEVLGLGEAALDRGPQARLLLFQGGVQHRVLELDLIPRVIVAAESPLVPRGVVFRPALQARLEEAMRTVTSLVMRRVVDETPPDQLPSWVLRELRESCLLAGSELHFERLAHTPMFETTTGAWVTPEALKVQHERFGPLWWTSAPIDWPPLEEERVALRLRPDEAKRLGQWIAVEEATQELELDRRARANRARPPVPSLEPTEAEQRAALSVVRLAPEEDDASHGVVVLLRPGQGERALHLHREMRGLGMESDPCYWPSLARVEDPSLSPNRTWDGVEPTIALARLRQRVKAAVDAELVRLVPTPTRKLAVLRVRAVPRELLPLPKGATLEGVVWLERERPGAEAGRLTLLDAGGERSFEPTREGRALPIRGILWLTGASFGTELAPRLALVLHRRMLERIASWVGDAPGSTALELAHLIQGVALGVMDPAPLTLALPCFVPAPRTIAVLFERVAMGERVLLASEEEVPAALAVHEPGDGPVLVDDGSPVAEALRLALGGSLVPFRSALRERVLGEPADVLAAPPVARVGGAADLTSGHESGHASDEGASLERELQARIVAAGVPGVHRVTQIPRRRRPLVELKSGELQLASQHPLVLALREAVATSAPRVDALLALVVARAVGAVRRAGEVGMETEHAVLRALLDRV